MERILIMGRKRKEEIDKKTTFYVRIPNQIYFKLRQNYSDTQLRDIINDFLRKLVKK